MQGDYIYRPHFVAGQITGNGTNNFTGSISLFRGDTLRSVRLMLGVPGVTDVYTHPHFILQTDNGRVAALGLGLPLPVTSGPTLFSAFVPWTTVAMNATVSYFSLDLTIPVGLTCDDTTRDILFDVLTGDTLVPSFFVVVFDIEPAQPPATK